MATHSGILAWRIQWTEEPGGLHGVAKSQTRLSNKAHKQAHVFNIIIHGGIKPQALLKSQLDTSTDTIQWKRCIASKDDEDVYQLIYF